VFICVLSQLRSVAHRWIVERNIAKNVCSIFFVDHNRWWLRAFSGPELASPFLTDKAAKKIKPQNTEQQRYLMNF
jgi:hypothetical protein